MLFKAILIGTIYLGYSLARVKEEYGTPSNCWNKGWFDRAAFLGPIMVYAVYAVCLIIFMASIKGSDEHIPGYIGDY